MIDAADNLPSVWTEGSINSPLTVGLSRHLNSKRDNMKRLNSLAAIILLSLGFGGCTTVADVATLGWYSAIGDMYEQQRLQRNEQQQREAKAQAQERQRQTQKQAKLRRGTLTFTSSRYEGQLLNGKMHGQGTYTWGSGTRHVGKFRNGKFTGRGTRTWASGNRYEGDWHDNKMHGQGTYTWADGRRYKGEFRNDKRTGRGTYTWSNGNRYVGDFRDGKLTGRGTFAWGPGKWKGHRYEGEFVDGDRHGQGTYIWPDGGRYVGQLHNSKFHGRGSRTWPNGNRYEGDWHDGKMRGRGTYTWADGRRYKGKFHNDKLHGHGTMTYADGHRRVGEWREGKPLQSGQQQQRSAAADPPRPATPAELVTAAEARQQARERQRQAQEQQERNRQARERHRQAQLRAQEQERQTKGRERQGQINESRCISGRMIRHTLADGHETIGHEITRIAPAPNVAGIARGKSHGQKNSNGQPHGIKIYHLPQGGSVQVSYYDNGMLLEECWYLTSSGQPSSVFTTYSGRKRDGVHYQFLPGGGGIGGTWLFETYRAGVRHGPSGRYHRGRPSFSQAFVTYVNGKWHGVKYQIFENGSFTFETYRAGVRHGPYGKYNARGRKTGYFGSYTNGNQNPGKVWYSDGVAR